MKKREERRKEGGRENRDNEGRLKQVKQKKGGLRKDRNGEGSKGGERRK